MTTQGAGGAESQFTVTTRVDAGRVWLVLSFRAGPEQLTIPSWGEIFRLPASGDQDRADVVKGASAVELALFHGGTRGRLVPAGSAHPDVGFTLLQDVDVPVDVSDLPDGRYLLRLGGMTRAFDLRPG